jgi:hypothetical protein
MWQMALQVFVLLDGECILVYQSATTVDLITHD